MRHVLFLCLLASFSSIYSAAESFGFSSQGGNNAPTNADQAAYSRKPEANTLYIQGLQYLRKGDSRIAGGSMLNAKKALNLFRQAARKDPQFALAYIGQADALDALSFSVAGGAAPGKIYRRQETAALKAVELDDSLLQAHSLLAEVYYDNAYDWPKAEKELKRVIELSPNSVMAHTRYAFFLATMGRFEEAEAQVKLAQTMDERSAAPNRAMLQILYWQHKDDEAVAQGLEALTKDKDNRATHFFLGFVYLHQGQFTKGIEEMKRGSFGDADSLAALAYAYAAAGDKTEVENTLAQLKHHPAYDRVPYGLAEVYIALHDKGRAIRLIEKAYQQRSNRMNRLKVDPIMDPLRQEPRFKRLMRKMNFQR